MIWFYSLIAIASIIGGLAYFASIAIRRAEEKEKDYFY
jgi:hypothetical protein